MASKSIVEKLWEVNPKAEIWWDSSPLIYENWRSKMIQKAHNKEEMVSWLDRLYNKNNRPEENIFKGVTTNPPLSYTAIMDNPDYWTRWVDELIDREGYTDPEVVFWRTYKEIVKRGAEFYMPIFEATNYTCGYL